MQRLTAKELQRRYRTGERNFANVDISGESLRGMGLKGIDLSGADLSRTDIRGTNFSEANLVGTQFVEAKAGTQRRHGCPGP
ncbi:pentapeptide repeat-containing protein [Nodosilinea nodulosa]|uniref:pentapeptide repeat-containing protein n=1 Tax=Nodosilinea nodulosa TaxID=416001 RepID=UPI000313C324|nr:pentapeptide repeat-containing protein [Nodosilinea nodulosa]